MASGATIPMAQSVTIPNNVLLVSPTSSAPQISDLKDKGLVFRAYPSDALQSKVLARRRAHEVRQGREAQRRRAQRRLRDGPAGALRVRVEAARRDDRHLTCRGTRIRRTSTRTPRKLVDGNPAGWVVIDFPDTFEKFAPSLVRSGKWNATKTLGIEALRNAETLDKIGDPVKGLSGIRRAAPRAARPARRSRPTGRRTSRARSRTRGSRARRSTRR